MKETHHLLTIGQMVKQDPRSIRCQVLKIVPPSMKDVARHIAGILDQENITWDKEYITRWFEDRFLNKPKVEDTWEDSFDAWYQVEDTIQNGVKRTNTGNQSVLILVEDTIQNGVKYTKFTEEEDICGVEDTIQNGVKNTNQGILN